MMNIRKLHQNEQGQTALEAAIILIAFVVVASIFAFAILSAGTASTERGEEAIYSGLESVQSSMTIRGAVIATEGTGAAADTVASVTFTVALVTGGEPVDLTAGANQRVIISYRDEDSFVNSLTFTPTFIGQNDTDMLLEDGELAQLVVTLPAAPDALAVDTQFTLEVKPPTGAVLNITRTTPAALEAIMELR